MRGLAGRPPALIVFRRGEGCVGRRTKLFIVSNKAPHPTIVIQLGPVPVKGLQSIYSQQSTRILISSCLLMDECQKVVCVLLLFHVLNCRSPMFFRL